MLRRRIGLNTVIDEFDNMFFCLLRESIDRGHAFHKSPADRRIIMYVRFETEDFIRRNPESKSNIDKDKIGKMNPARLIGINSFSSETDFISKIFLSEAAFFPENLDTMSDSGRRERRIRRGDNRKWLFARLSGLPE